MHAFFVCELYLTYDNCHYITSIWQCESNHCPLVPFLFNALLFRPLLGSLHR
jgi:hypothetical protein